MRSRQALTGSGSRLRCWSRLRRLSGLASSCCRRRHVDRDPLPGQIDDVVLRRIVGVGQQAPRQDLQAIFDLFHHRDGQAGVIAPVRRRGRHDDARVRRHPQLNVIGRPHGTIGKAHQPRFGVAQARLHLRLLRLFLLLVGLGPLGLLRPQLLQPARSLRRPPGYLFRPTLLRRPPATLARPQHRSPNHAADRPAPKPSAPAAPASSPP